MHGSGQGYVTFHLWKDCLKNDKKMTLSCIGYRYGSQSDVKCNIAAGW